MKRMSEVFELPVTTSLMGDEHAKVITSGGYLHYCLEDNNYWMLSDIEHAQHAAHAINHVDVLADALASLLETCLSNGRLTTDDAACALEALKSYVGDDK